MCVSIILIFVLNNKTKNSLANGATIVRCFYYTHYYYSGPGDPRLQILLEAGSDMEGAPFCAPTVIDGVTPKMALWREETFGPLIAIATFSTEAEVHTELDCT
ncbi:hypothetical protein T492DRAFT_210376 [Pavlovales sp. CCMP2436]|nr:hypothetical protein T492DRAFT_210376 [Pavlovales sp. CCMP2436]